MTDHAENRALVERFWEDLYRHDFDACGAYFAEDGVYTDVPVSGGGFAAVAEGAEATAEATNGAGEVGATGPEEVAARLRLGLEPIERNIHHIRHIVCEGDVVVTEHVEEWFWGPEPGATTGGGEHVALPFVSVMELRDGLIVRWWDYWNLPTLMDGAPQWWLEHIAKGYH